MTIQSSVIGAVDEFSKHANSSDKVVSVDSFGLLLNDLSKRERAISCVEMPGEAAFEWASYGTCLRQCRFMFSWSNRT